MARKKKDSAKRQQRLQARRRKEKERRARQRKADAARGGKEGGVRAISEDELEAAYVDPAQWREGGEAKPSSPAKKRRGRPRKPAASGGPPAGGADGRAVPADAIERSARYRHWASVCARVREQGVDEAGVFRLERLDSKLRHWLLRARLRKSRGGLRPWQVSLIGETGYDWTVPERKRKKKAVRKVRKRAPKKKKKVAVRKPAVWETRVARVREAAAEQDFDFFHLPDRALRRWLRRQRSKYRKGTLPAGIRTALEAIGFDWERTELSDAAYESWSRNLEAYRDLVRRRGEGAVPNQREEYGLYQWFVRQRAQRRRGELPERRRQALDAAGFPWETRPKESGRWREYYERLKAFRDRYGHANITQDDPDDPSLGKWLARQRRAYRSGRLSPQRKEALDSLGVHPNPRPGEGGGARREEERVLQGGLWRRRYEELAEYCRERCGGGIPDPRSLPKPLALWLASQRRWYRKGRLAEKQIRMLDELGMVWDLSGAREVRWSRRYDDLRRFRDRHGHTSVPAKDDPELARWAERQRSLQRRGKLPEDRRRRLEEIDFTFEVQEQPSEQWKKQYEALLAFRREHGHCRVPRLYPPNQSLAEWAAQQKQRHRRGLLKPCHIEPLEAVGFPWAVPRKRREE